MNKLTLHSKITLNNGTKIPILGFGTWKIAPGPSAQNAISHALDTGFRHIDTARIYLNEKSIGKAIAKSSVDRKDIFLTTKLWNSDQGYGKTLKAFDKSLSRLGQEYVDLYLMHWPVPELRLETWRAMVEIYKSGRAKAIGVSNFTEEHLAELLSHTDVVPAVNQVEFHPFLYQKILQQYCNDNKIILTAYSPLTHGRRLQDPMLSEIAAKHAKSVVQVMLRWNLQLGNVVLVKSTQESRMQENINVFDFELDAKDMQKIENLNENYRTCWDPTGM